jgi:hypothetical protein
MLVDEEDVGWQPINRQPTTKFDLAPYTRERMHNVAQYLYVTNPFAHQLVELSVALTIGSGPEFEFRSRATQDVVTRFWEDPINNWPKKLPERIRELSLYGEQFYSTSVSQSGRVRIGYINPLDVSEIVVDKENVEIYKKVRVKTGVDATSFQDIPVINMDEDPESETFGYRVGEVFVFNINKPIDATRGNSDLLAIADAISMYDQFIFNTLERSQHMNSWLWDVELTGKTESEIVKWLKTIQARSPRPGSIRAHNENVKWNAVAPNLHNEDLEDSAKIFKSYVLGGVGYPDYFFGETQYATRGIASEASMPVFKRIERRQGIVKSILFDMLNYVIDQAILHNTLPKTENREFTITLPELALRDLQRTSGAVYRLTQAMQLAKQEGWLKDIDCRRIINEVMRELGLPVNKILDTREISNE